MMHYLHISNKQTAKGQVLLDIALETNMVIPNTQFQKRKGKLWTFIADTSGLKLRIDYILINQKWKNSFRNVEAYSSCANVGSDH